MPLVPAELHQRLDKVASTPSEAHRVPRVRRVVQRRAVQRARRQCRALVVNRLQALKPRVASQRAVGAPRRLIARALAERGATPEAPETEQRWAEAPKAVLAVRLVWVVRS
jgi:hypothetical protein